MALAADRVLPKRQGPLPSEFAYVVQAGSRVWRGSLIALCADGTVVPAGSANTGAAQVAVVGVAAHLQDATGVGMPSTLSQPGGRVRAEHGTYLLPFDVAPTAASIGAAVYAVDDQTVSLSAGGAPAHLPCGKLVGFDEFGRAWTQI